MTDQTVRLETFMHAERTAQHWIDGVADELGTHDQHFTYRVLRAWLWTVRDRLNPDGAAHFAAQLPLLLRGVYFDGWVPSRVPTKYDADQFLEVFAREARVPIGEAGPAAAAVTAGLARLCSPGQLDHALAQLPARLRDMLAPGASHVTGQIAGGSGRATTPEPPAASGQQWVDERITRLERATQAVVDALHVLLVEGLEESPTDGTRPRRIGAAARHAHHVLLEALHDDSAAPSATSPETS